MPKQASRSSRFRDGYRTKNAKILFLLKLFKSDAPLYWKDDHTVNCQLLHVEQEQPFCLQTKKIVTVLMVKDLLQHNTQEIERRV